MTEKVGAILRSLFSPESLILWVTVYNCVVVWMASEPPGLCWFCPWYQHWSFTNVPSRLFAAACCLRVGGRWGYLAAAVLTGFTLLPNVSWYAHLYHDGLLPWSLGEVWRENPMLSLHTQYLLAGVILVYAAVCFGQTVGRRRVPYM
jgi:hypothetical protein